MTQTAQGKNIYISNEELEEKLDIMALIVKLHGKKYIPLFEVLHEEKERRANHRDILDIAMQRAENVQASQLTNHR